MRVKGRTMTKNKDLKKKTRARAAKTGESYTEARRKTLAAREATLRLEAHMVELDPRVDVQASLNVGNLPPEKVAGFLEDVNQEPEDGLDTKLAVTAEPLPDLPVKDVAPLLEVLKYLNSGDAHPTEIRIMVKGALEQFNRQYPKVLLALVDPSQVEDDEDWDVPAKLNGKDVMLPMKTTYETIVLRAGMRGCPSMTYYWNRGDEENGGILHFGDEIVVKPGMTFNMAHTNNA